MCLLIWSSLLNADTVTTAVRGTFNQPQENGCLLVSAYYFRVDCSYINRWPTLNGRPIPWVGPTISAVYYAADSPHARPAYTPQPGDDRIALALSGSVSIDDRGTAEPDDDTLAAVFTIGPAARNGQTRGGKGAPLTRVVESWTAVTHRMAPTAVSAASRDASGGWVYTIAAGGWPHRLCAAERAAGCFPTSGAPALAEGEWGQSFWESAEPVGIARSALLDANPGGMTTADFAGYRCQTSVPGTACTTGVGLWGPPGHHGLSNLLLQVVTDAEHRVQKVSGFWTIEYRLNAGPPEIGGVSGEDNSWFGGHLEAVGAAGDP